MGMAPILISFVVVAAFASVSVRAVDVITYTFQNTTSLLAAQAQGRFNSTSPLVVVLEPGIYGLSEVLSFTAPSLELRGPSAEIICDGANSAFQLSITCSLLMLGLSVSNCSGILPAVNIDSPFSSLCDSTITLDSLRFHGNTAGALAIVANTSNITLSGCSFDSNSLRAVTPFNNHAAFISAEQGTIAMRDVTFSSNGINSNLTGANVMQAICMGMDCRFTTSNSSWNNNKAVSSIQGFGSVGIFGSAWVGNTGENTLSVIQATGVPPDGPGIYNVEISGSTFTQNYGSLHGVLLYDCRSALVRGSTFSGNRAGSEGVR